MKNYSPTLLLPFATRYRISFFLALCAFLLSSILLISSCKSKDDLSNLETPEFAIPVINTRLSVGDILKILGNVSSIIIEPNGQIKMHYAGQTVEKTATELLSFPDVIPFYAPQASSSIPVQPVGGMSIKSVALKSGTIAYGFTATESMTVTVTIPELSKGGAAFRQTETVPVGVFQSVPYNLSGYTLAPGNGQLTISYEAKKSTGTLVTNLDFRGTFNQLTYSSIEGYMTERPYNFDKQRIFLNLFTDLVSGSLEFVDPKVVINVENSFGFGMTSRISSLNAFGLKSSGFIDTLPITYPKKGIDFAYPAITEKGQSKITPTYYLDRTNSNVADIINKNPLMIEYDIDAVTQSSGSNLVFLTDQSKIKISADFELPLYMKAEGFYYEQSVAPDLSSLSSSTVQSAEMKIVTISRIPGKVNLQIYFKDAHDNILDSLFNNSQDLLDGAPVDADGNVNGTAKKEIIAPIDRAKIDRIKDATKVIIGTTLSTTNNGKVAVRINNNQTLELRMGMKVKTQL
jgi:hypothetical protein